MSKVIPIYKFKESVSLDRLIETINIKQNGKWKTIVRAKRFTVDTIVLVDDQMYRLSDISTSGICVEGNIKLNEGTFKVYLSGSNTVSFVGTQVHCSQDKSGFEITSISDIDLRKLYGYLYSLERQSRSIA
jgi:hypothetical protein